MREISKKASEPAWHYGAAHSVLWKMNGMLREFFAVISELADKYAGHMTSDQSVAAKKVCIKAHFSVQ